MPIFPELLPILDAAWDAAPEGAEFVITRFRNGETNLRTGLERIIEKAGLIPWPKLFQNLRSTRETELAETFPLHVVVAWLGNSQLVAAKHYLQVTDEHFAKASHIQKQTHNQTHSAAEINEMRETGVVRLTRDNEKGPEFPGLSVPFLRMHNQTVPPTGVEPVS